jgi:hypothetical protein
MLMRHLWMILILLLPSTAGAQTCGPDPAPAPAAAWGYTCEVFWDHFDDIATIDVNNTKAPGFKWYVNNRWPGLAAGRNWNTTTITPPGDIAIVSGGMRLTPTFDDGVNMQSCVTNGLPNSWNGYAIPGRFYVEVEVTSVSPSIGIVPPNTWWPAFWTMAVEFLSAPDPSPALIIHSELDIFESINNPGSTGRNVHWWSVNGTSQTDHPVTYGADTTVLNGNKFAALVVSAEQNGGTGFVAGYVNDVHQTSGGPGDRAWPPADANYNKTATDHHCLMISSGKNQALTLKAVKVWGPPPASGGGRVRIFGTRR